MFTFNKKRFPHTSWMVQLKHYGVGIGAFKDMNIRLCYKAWKVYYDQGLTPEQALSEDFKES